MIKVEYCGECYGCPFCNRDVSQSGNCGCGAKVEIANFTAEAAADGEQMTRQLAEWSLSRVAQITAYASKLAPFKRGSARISFFVKNGNFFRVIAKK